MPSSLPMPRGDLRTCRQVTRAGETPFVDEALGDHVEPRLGGRSTPPRCEFFRHRRFFGAHAGDLLAGEIELDGIDAVFNELAHAAAHFFGAGNDNAEIEPLMRNM